MPEGRKAGESSISYRVGSVGDFREGVCLCLLEFDVILDCEGVKIYKKNSGEEEEKRVLTL